jgi:hypothetical protein
MRTGFKTGGTAGSSAPFSNELVDRDGSTFSVSRSLPVFSGIKKASSGVARNSKFPSACSARVGDVFESRSSRSRDERSSTLVQWPLEAARPPLAGKSPLLRRKASAIIFLLPSPSNHRSVGAGVSIGEESV